MKTTKISEQAIAGHLRKLERDGFTVLENVIPNDLLAELKAALAEIEQAHEFGYRDTAFEGTRTTRIYNLLGYHPAFAKIPIFDGTLPLVERMLDPGLQLSSLSAICPGPGQVPQPLHSDSQMIPLPRPHLPIAVNSMWALSDFTEANGATRIVPGSHNFDHDPDYDGSYETVCAEMPAGSVLVWYSTLWHGGGHNQSE
ncbi:MAG: phytanoyl-CoA dioxygenase family protein, partial [Alphaproteobacteria bacterium]|nr:phytanoyl-CoA dioxygenase family protein [Alphaproteobacteria bacterium]